MSELPIGGVSEGVGGVFDFLGLYFHPTLCEAFCHGPDITGVK